jgi:ferredoxin
VIVTNGMKSILEINEADMYAVVQPGVVTAKLAAAVEAKGLFYPPDPGSQAVSTIGGNVAENAGGLRGLKYGVTRDYVMGVSFFDVEGNLVKSGSRTVKCATGYNLTGLMVGSEGTLGVFSEIILKLIPLPAHRKAMMAVFESLEKASETVAAIIADRIVPATLEFLDNFTIRAVEDFSKAGLPRDAAAMLLVELDGHAAQVEEDAERVEALCRSMGATSIRVARDAAERDRVWAARRCGPVGPGPAQTHAGAGRRNGAPQPHPGHGGRHRADRQALRSDHRHLRTRRRRQPAPHHPDRQTQPCGMGAGGKGHRRHFRSKPWPWGDPFRRTRHRHRQIPLPGKGDQRRNDPVSHPVSNAPWIPTTSSTPARSSPRKYSNMASMKALARLMRELEDQLVVCMRCGMCQSVCPVFDQTGREADVARGKLALLSGLMEHRCSTIPKGSISG